MSLEMAAWALVILAVADWFATVKLVQAALRVKEAALEERATISVILTVAASGAAFLAAAFLARVSLPPGLGTLILVGILLLISVPQLLWYAAYRLGRFS